jgi:hypothetical protein
MMNVGTTTRIPSHPGQYLDWQQPKMQTVALSHSSGGGGVYMDSFSYIAPTPKYAEAYSSLGPYPVYWSYKSYNIGNQPYSPIDAGVFVAFRTPTLPNWYSLSKVSPKTSAAGVLQAQQTMSSLLQLRQPIGTVTQ